MSVCGHVMSVCGHVMSLCSHVMSVCGHVMVIPAVPVPPALILHVISVKCYCYASCTVGDFV